jgi:hypothetical protein
MKRRSFLAEAAASSQTAPVGGKQVIELRTYTFATPEKRQAFERFVASGLIPALNRAGVQPVGAFVAQKADNPEAKFEGETAPEMHLVLPHPTPESAMTLETRLASDTGYTAALAGLPDGPKEASAYARYESTLMLAFDQSPKVEVPTKAAGRVMQLRVYESHNAERSRMKVRMFNEGGEIRIFREVGMNPVFFGHAFTGSRLPNLTYMLGFESDTAMKAAWGKFGAHPDWQKLRVDPLYKDTVSRITNVVLRPVAGSQI